MTSEKDKKNRRRYPSASTRRVRKVNTLSPQERETFRQRWRVYKTLERLRARIRKLNSNEQSNVSKRSEIDELEQKIKATKATLGTVMQPAIPQVKRVVVNNLKSDKSKPINNLLKKHKGSAKRRRTCSHLSLQRKRNRKARNVCKTQQNELTEHSAAIGDLQNNMTNIEENTGNTTSLTEVQNSVVTSEIPDDLAIVTPTERSEFETFKSSKRRRQKADSTDESIVSSTTSDEDTNPRPLQPHKPNQKKDQPSSPNNALEKDDTVSSTPVKEPLGAQGDLSSSEDELPLNRRIKQKEALEGEAPKNIIVHSDDEMPLKRRIKRKSGARNHRKKIRISVKSLVSAAKTSKDASKC